MRIYSYKAINDRGVKVSGTIETDSRASAEQMLVARGLIPSSVSDQKAASPLTPVVIFLNRFRTVKPSELILFTKQFRTMIRAGVPMMTLLHTLETQTEDHVLKKVLVTVIQDISEGASLHVAFGKHPRVFSPLYCSMERAGESSGALTG